MAPHSRRYPTTSPSPGPAELHVIHPDGAEERNEYLKTRGG